MWEDSGQCDAQIACHLAAIMFRNSLRKHAIWTSWSYIYAPLISFEKLCLQYSLVIKYLSGYNTKVIGA